MVYVLSKTGQPLMPTEDHRMVRLLLKSGTAKVVKRTPFTVRLLVTVHNYKQEVTLGVDTGSKHIGLSATTKEKELYATDVELRTDVTDLISTRRELRRSRRNRKTRYRKARFNNRIKSKHKGWLTPSIEQKISTHLAVVERVHKILPISKIVVETASFDIQKIKNPNIQGKEYQRGEQLNFWNVREYVLFRDNHTCQCCKGKSKDKTLNVHHIESRKTGGDAPNNLITLCKTCHTGYHKGTVTLPKTIKRGMSFRDAAFMGIIRWSFYERLKAMHPNVKMTYGYITKNVRITHSLPKEHYVDARCISGNPLAKPLGYYFYQKKVRCHNRQIHKTKFQKGGKRKVNQTSYKVFGFKLYDKVLYQEKEYYIKARRQSGTFTLATLAAGKYKTEPTYKKLKFLETTTNYLVERRSSQPLKGLGPAPKW